MIFSERYKYVYLAPPKTGTTSMEHTLRTFFEGEIYKDWQDANVKAIRYQRHVNHVPEEFKDYFVFGTVRNPYTWEISRWKFWDFNKVGFPEYVRSLRPHRTLCRLLHQNPDYSPPTGCVKFKLNGFVRLENIADDFHKLPFVDKVVPIVHWTRTKHPEQVYYTTELANIVKRVRAPDFLAFDYSTNVPDELRILEFL